MAPSETVEMLNDIFCRFDGLVDRHGVEKIKTIGDAYMVVSGLPSPRPDHARVMAEFALDMKEMLGETFGATDRDLELRIGINSGPVVAGVIGRKKFLYDLWGDTVNTASRMESHGLPGEIQVSASSYEAMKNAFDFEDRGVIDIKGKGKLQTYLLKGRI